MRRRERGVVVEERGRTVVVRLRASSACAGCASAGACRGAGEGEARLVEAGNPVGARRGDGVEILVDAGSRLGAAARRWAPPLLGLLLGAAGAQALATVLLGPGLEARAAGIGGIAGAAAGTLLARALPPRPGARPGRIPEVARVTAAGVSRRVDSGPRDR